MEAKIYNQKGESKSSVTLPEDIFGLPWNADLVHEVVRLMNSNSRTNVAHTKTRGEVRGGGKKPWKQKGTGKARHGSTRSPIWVGGGVSGGPRNDKNFDRKVNKKMKAKALYVILSKKFRDGEILFVNNFPISSAVLLNALIQYDKIKPVLIASLFNINVPNCIGFVFGFILNPISLLNAPSEVIHNGFEIIPL